MGDCNCRKNARPTGFGSTARQGEAEANRSGSTTLNQESRAMNAAQEQAVQAGGQASFALRDRSGRVQSFGSRLERNAFMAREGGTIV